MQRKRGDTIELRLSVIGNPTNDVTFQVLLPSNTVLNKDADAVRGDVIDVRLLIQVDDFGLYIIVAMNSVGATEIAFNVTERSSTSSGMTSWFCAAMLHTHISCRPFDVFIEPLHLCYVS